MDSATDPSISVACIRNRYRRYYQLYLKCTFIYRSIYLNRQKLLQPDTGLPDQPDDIPKYISNSGYTSGQ